MASPLARRIADAEQVLREQMFTANIPAEVLDPEGWQGIGEMVTVQGIIDLCFMENGQWVLVDYKTNIMGGERTDAILLEHYTPQLRTYREVLQRITGIPVREAGLYLLDNGHYVTMNDGME